MSSKKPRKASLKGSGDRPLSRGRSRPDAVFPVAPGALSLPDGYGATLQEIKDHLRSARVRAIQAANPIMIEAYWNTGKIILSRQQEAGWGANVIDRLAADLQAEFPSMSGLSTRNLLAMEVFAREFPDGPIAQQPVAQLPWGHLIQIVHRLKDPAVRDFYIRLYLSAVDDLLRHPDDQPSIGLLLCRTKSRLVVEYTLRGLDQSIAVAAWQTRLTESLPKDLRGSLPTIEEIETELSGNLPNEPEDQP